MCVTPHISEQANLAAKKAENRDSTVLFGLSRQKLARDELPYTAIEHDGRIRPQTDRSDRSPGKPNREPLRARVITKPGRQQQSSWRCISGGGSCGWIVYNDATTRAAAFRCREIEPRSTRDADER